MRHLALVIAAVLLAGCTALPSPLDARSTSDAPTPWYDQAPPAFVDVAQPLVVRGVEERLRPEGRVGAYDADGFRSLEHGEPSSSDTAAVRLAFHDEESWRAWYREYDRPGSGWNEEGEWTRYHQPAPEVDFSREVAVAVLMGSQPSGGYAVRVVEVREEPEQTVVVVVSYHPPEGAGATLMMTAPYHLVSVPLRDAPIVFVERTQAGWPPEDG